MYYKEQEENENFEFDSVLTRDDLIEGKKDIKKINNKNGVILVDDHKDYAKDLKRYIQIFPYNGQEDDGSLVILLGFSQIIIGGYLLSFFIYFIPLTNTLYSTTLIIPLSILYYSALRSLEDSYAICTLNESNNQSAISYHC